MIKIYLRITHLIKFPCRSHANLNCYFKNQIHFVHMNMHCTVKYIPSFKFISLRNKILTYILFKHALKFKNMPILYLLFFYCIENLI